MAPKKPQCLQAMAAAGGRWRRRGIRTDSTFLFFLARSLWLRAVTGTKRKGRAGDGPGQRRAKKGRVQEAGASRSGRSKRKAPGGDDGRKESKRRRTNQDEPTKKEESGGEGPDDDGDDEAVILPDVPRPIVWGRRSRNDGKPWTCPKCRTVNEPSRHLFVDLPAFECSKCKEPGRACFKFSFGNLACNGVCPIGKIQDQKNTDFCVSHAFAMQAEMTMRITKVFSELATDTDDFPTFCPYSLQTHAIMAMDINDGADFYSERAKERMAEVIARVGIDDMLYQDRYKVGKVERVDPDFPTICRVLADGYPLSTSIIPGSGFDDLEYGKVYKSRCNVKNFREFIPEGYRAIGHLIVLVGASRSETRDSYYFATTYGDQYCLRIDKVTGTTSGGIGKIRAKDIAGKSFQFIRLDKVE